MGVDFLQKFGNVSFNLVAGQLSLGSMLIPLMQTKQVCPVVFSSSIVKAIENVAVPGNSGCILRAKTVAPVNEETMLFEPCSAMLLRNELQVVPGVVDVKEGVLSFPVYNCMPSPLEIYANSTLGNLSECDFPPFNQHAQVTYAVEDSAIMQPVHPVETVDLSNPQLTIAQQAQLRQLLKKYKDIFSQNDEDLSRCSIVKHSIDTGDNPPTKVSTI